MPIINQSGSLIPHSPFGGGMRATQNSKLGTLKSLSDLDRAQKILSLVLPTMILDFAHSSAEEQIRTLIKLLFRGTVALGAKVHQKIAIAT